MCGRYASSKSAGELAQEFDVEELRLATELPASYNVAPTDEVYIVAERTSHETEAPARQLRTARWGLVPSWSKDAKGGARMINARVETVAEKPAFRKAFAARRCLVPADGYFEWYQAENGTKQPFYIHPVDGGSLAMAGLYEIWRDPGAPEGEGFLWSCTVITTTATDELGLLHDRMPLLVERDRWGAWLGEGGASLDLLTPATHVEAWPVTTAVGNVRNNGPELIAPLTEA
ncbi:SOS response-associated peptidase [Nocardioides sp. Kera G14]|uniref:SOS response-associated peptidase n=1 Tax=Nocardioides sp. Kera G14 TaxID=2884264 RepID=UPI001D116F6B|nr:SOS response-associated peptidase family protein [Nocardioides sp. Kera G14]UDY24680.1 SOS response-associated peptidase [Nocardioides sp. Kera G14]